MQTECTIGSAYLRNGLTDVDLWRSRKDPIGVLTFRLKPEAQWLEVGNDPITLRLGYEAGALWTVFTGTIDLPTGDPIRARDRMAQLAETKVVQTFLSATPQEILVFGLKKAGVQTYRMTTRAFPKRKFVASGESVTDMIRNVNRAWGLDFAPYCDAENLFVWDDLVPQEQLPVFAYGANIIDLDLDEDGGRLLTVGVPYLDHSQFIYIDHPELKSEVLVDTIHHFSTEQETLRSEIFFSYVGEG